MQSIPKNLALLFIGSLLGATVALGISTFQPAGNHSPATSNSSPRTVEASPAILGEEVTAEIYQRLTPAVVNVTNRRAPTSGGIDSPFPERGVGSGVIVDDQGHILTNNHVVDRADKLDVTLVDGTRVPAQLIGRDPGNDLALIQIEVNDRVKPKIAVAPLGDSDRLLPGQAAIAIGIQIEVNDRVKPKIAVAPLGDSDRLLPGQAAIAIGNPFGFQSSMTSGIISSLGRTFATDSGRPIRHMIQTDAAINPGNSGGPLINSAGQVVGINTAIESPVRGFVGIGFAVPINVARRVLPDMMAGQTVSHAWLGVSGITLDEETARTAGLNAAAGVYVVHVLPNSPADRASLRGAIATSGASGAFNGQLPIGGDVVTSVDGRPLSSADQLTDYVDSKRAGDQVTLTLLRDGNPLEVRVTLGDWPEG
ncbi:MAG: trypsin-like peptidase domain-containing protein [Chloroflexi bacterium]|nr:trypsin-like peptidase domain-containing protein [Chloroflexota bacterium]